MISQKKKIKISLCYFVHFQFIDISPNRQISCSLPFKVLFFGFCGKKAPTKKFFKFTLSFISSIYIKKWCRTCITTIGIALIFFLLAFLLLFFLYRFFFNCYRFFHMTQFIFAVEFFSVFFYTDCICKRPESLLRKKRENNVFQGN